MSSPAEKHLKEIPSRFSAEVPLLQAAGFSLRSPFPVLSNHKAAGIGLFSDRKDNPSAVWEQPHTADAYQPLIQTGMRFP